jgi:hypothetical protein
MSKAPKWFMVMAVLGLLWNLLGCAAYLYDVTLTPQDIAGMSADQQAMYAARPPWAVAATAVAVWFGAVGCIGLIMRKRWATIWLSLSLLGVIVQDIYLFAIGGATAAVGAGVYALQSLVLLIAVGLVWLGRMGLRRHWLM